jgi:hypothetical protein
LELRSRLELGERLERWYQLEHRRKLAVVIAAEPPTAKFTPTVLATAVLTATIIGTIVGTVFGAVHVGSPASHLGCVSDSIDSNGQRAI